MQRLFVALNAASPAEALFEPHAWYRAIVADGLQGRGYGRRAIELIADHVHPLPGVTRLLVSWVPGIE